MDPLEIMIALQDAAQIITKARISFSGKSNVLWEKLYHAGRYLEKQLEELLAPDAEEEATHA